MRRRTTLWVLAVAAVAGATVLALVVWGPVRHHGPSTKALEAALVRQVTFDPVTGATTVSPDSTVVIGTGKGRLLSVLVTSSSGQQLPGTLDARADKWTSTGPLATATVYEVAATVAGRSRLRATARSSFTTLTPAALVTATVWPDGGLSVGVGQPIVLRFSQPVTDPAARQALLSHLDLSMSQPVPVGAYWFSDTELHLRPQNYWPSGENVALSDSLDGWDAGAQMWGEGSTSVTFSVGDSRISTVNLATHQMTVTDNGQVVATYPISGGSDQYPTMDGIHIVMDRESQVQMVSSTVGIPVNSPGGYDETVYWDVHISDSGEYVHGAPWSVGSQGSVNVSHGCVNLSPSNAEQFFNFSRVGDLVNVIGGTRAPVPGDHGVMDWETPWSSFVPVTVSPLH